MSLILEALKKSEQQRRLGEVPTFSTPAPSARRRRTLLPLLALLIVAALGLGWWLRRAPPAPATTSAAPAQAATAAAAPRVDAMRSMPVAHAPESPKPGAVKSAVKPAAPPSAPATSAVVLPMPTTDRPGSVAPLPAMPVASGAAAPHPGQVVASGPGAPHPAGPAIAGPTRPDSPPPAAAPIAAATKPPPAPAAPAPTATRSAPTAAKAPALPSVWDLPYATRKDIPELELTMHVYSDQPSDRFVVAKGERHVEGDDLGDGVMLREISPDGMVLEFKGQRFLYPREGR